MGSHEDYVDTSLPREVEVLPFTGERYEAEVPDTLDLAERAAMAINALTRCVDPDMDYRMYFTVHFARRPPLLGHQQVSDACDAKFLEALPLDRWASGSTLNAEVDARMMAGRLHLTSRDGLTYMPYHETWISEDPLLARYRRPFSWISCDGRMVGTLATWYQHDGNPLWLELGRKKIDRLLSLGVWDEEHEGFHLTRMFYMPEDVGPVDHEPGDEWYWKPFKSLELQGFIAHSAMHFYRVTGYERALDLARALTRYVWNRGDGIRKDGRYLTHHFHRTVYSLMGTLEYALATGDQELLKAVQRGYEYGRAYGDELTGYFPEVMPSPPTAPRWEIHRERAGSPIGNTCETCEVADMIVLALKMSLAGVGDYWEDVDRYLRNQFVEMQMLRTDWIETTMRARLETPQGLAWLRDKTGRPGGFRVNLSEGGTTAEQAAERAVGSFAGWASPNDFAPVLEKSAIMHCCTGNGARALAYAWDSIVKPEGNGKMRVNLLLNRASPWVDVDSHLPYEGRVDLHVKTVSDLRVRLPEATMREAVRCRVDGGERALRWDGSYVALDGLKQGDRVTVTFPQDERVVFRYIGENMYKLTLKGNTVIDIDPEGEIYPMYQRDHYRLDRAPLKRVTRFVSDETFQW